MLYEGEELREIIDRTSNEIELRNEHGRCCRTLSSAEGLALDLDVLRVLEIGAAFDFYAVLPKSLRSIPVVVQRNG
jgi:hypothetical protein